MFLLLRWLYRRYRARPSDGSHDGRHRRPTAPAPAPAASRGPLALVLHQARYDLRAFLQNKQGRFFTLLLPLVFLVIFVSVFGNNTVGPHHVKASTYYVPGISALAVISASFVNLVISITAQRETGVLKRRRTTPVPAWVLIAGRTLTAIVVSLTVMTALLAIGRLAYGVHLPATAIPAIALTATVGSATFCILGYALITTIASADAAQPTVQAIILPLYFISGVFIPNASLPSGLRHLAEVFPVQHLANGLHHPYDPAVHGSGLVWADLAVLALWALAGLAIALRRFNWAPAATTA
jgi:ABC-2 type transport system permease protein